jgi:hypothetical protein
MRHRLSEPTPTDRTNLLNRLLVGTCARTGSQQTEAVLHALGADSAADWEAREPIPTSREGEGSDHAGSWSPTDAAAMVESDPPKPTPEDIDRHARRLLESICEAFPAGCQLAARDVQRCYRQMCFEAWWCEPLSWPAVSRRLRKLAGTRKAYRWRGGRRVVVHDFPEMSELQRDCVSAVDDAEE